MTNRHCDISLKRWRLHGGAVLAVLLLVVAGCSTSDSPGADADETSFETDELESPEYEDFEEFAFPSPERRDFQCDGDCGPRTTDMCDLAKSGDVLAIVRVLDITEHKDECEDRPYRYDFREVEIDVIDVAAGDQGFANATHYRSFLRTGHVESSKPYIMKLSQLDGVWWGSGLIELVPDGASTEVSPQQPTSEHQGGAIYDLPTNRADFVAEADRVWNNYKSECDPEGRRGTDLTHMQSHIYDKSCRDSGGTGSEVVNNANGPVPGDDNYDAGD